MRAEALLAGAPLLHEVLEVGLLLGAGLQTLLDLLSVLLRELRHALDKNPLLVHLQDFVLRVVAVRVFVEPGGAVHEPLPDATAVEPDPSADVAHVRDAGHMDHARRAILRHERGLRRRLAAFGHDPCVLARDLKVLQLKLRLFRIAREEHLAVGLAFHHHVPRPLPTAPFERHLSGGVAHLPHGPTVSIVREHLAARGAVGVEKLLVAILEKRHCRPVRRRDDPHAVNQRRTLLEPRALARRGGRASRREQQRAAAQRHRESKHRPSHSVPPFTMHSEDSSGRPLRPAALHGVTRNLSGIPCGSSYFANAHHPFLAKACTSE